MERVTFTCTVNGSSLRWEPSDDDRFSVLTTLYNVSELVMPQPGYTVTLTAVTDTTITSTLSRTAEDGITVECVDPFPTVITVGSTTIGLVGETIYNISDAHNFFIFSQIHQDHLPSFLTLLGAVQLMQLV